MTRGAPDGLIALARTAAGCGRGRCPCRGLRGRRRRCELERRDHHPELGDHTLGAATRRRDQDRWRPQPLREVHRHRVTDCGHGGRRRGHERFLRVCRAEHRRSRRGRACMTARTSGEAVPIRVRAVCRSWSATSSGCSRPRRSRGPYVLVGTSGGGYITAGYAYAHPRQVAGMVFVDVPAPFRNPPREVVEAPTRQPRERREARLPAGREGRMERAHADRGHPRDDHHRRAPSEAIKVGVPVRTARDAAQRRRPEGLARPQPTREADRGPHRPRRGGRRPRARHRRDPRCREGSPVSATANQPESSRGESATFGESDSRHSA